MIRAGIIGGAGYTGGELIRILLRHPGCEIAYINSNSQAGKKVYSVHKDLLGETEISFSSDPDFNVDVVFLCLAHGGSVKFVENNNIPETVKIIDLSQDFRLVKNNRNEFVYGLPEVNHDLIKNSHLIANPGCFATAIQLAILPLAANKLLEDNIHVTAITGSTGAGQKLSNTVHFTWRSSNISFYKVFKHQHLKEINQTINGLQTNWNKLIHFVPVRGNFTRGILAGVYTTCYCSIDEAIQIYDNYYHNQPFTILSDEEVDIKQAVNTNKCIIHLMKSGNQLFISSVIDNLLKGASGQAVQNMNLMFGLDETTGLMFKPAAF